MTDRIRHAAPEPSPAPDEPLLRHLIGDALRRARRERGLTLREVAEAARGAGIAVEVKVAGTPVRLPVGTDSAAYRTVQEALTNVVRHSGASRARVRIVHEPSWTTVEVSDDGRGTVGPPAAGNGITGMRERAALVGGEVDVGPAEGGGFRVVVRLPVDGGPDRGEDRR